MRKIVFLLCLYVFSNGLVAQPVNLGVRGGLAIPNIVSGSDNPLSNGYSSRFAGCGGVFSICPKTLNAL